ncbi:MAG: isoprenylcysteine carboxylmethyltransferase family protein [Anaerolineales bacterium]|jgi:protein-S-isoprenylcysteine O-methyltransferase Ste14
MKGTRKIILATILTIAAVGQIILSFLLYDENGNTTIRNIGWVILWISAIFGWLPIFTLRKLGGVPQGKGYVRTTVLVDRGVYAIVRHPQYLAGMLLGLALTLIAQHWIVAVLGAAAIIVYYVDTYEEEASSIEKFGEQYIQYMKKVPRVNFLLGILRFVQAKQQ